MTSHHARKSAVRDRMARNGEPYSTARKNLISTPVGVTSGAAGAPAARKSKEGHLGPGFEGKGVDLGHLPVLLPLLRHRKDLLIVGDAGAGKDVTLNALLDLPESEGYVTPVALGFWTFPDEWGADPSQDNTILDLTHPGIGYSAFRGEARAQFPGQPTACVMQTEALGQGGLRGVREDTVVVALEHNPLAGGPRVQGIRTAGAIRMDLTGGMGLREALATGGPRMEPGSEVAVLPPLVMDRPRGSARAFQRLELSVRWSSAPGKGPQEVGEPTHFICREFLSRAGWMVLISARTDRRDRFRMVGGEIQHVMSAAFHGLSMESHGVPHEVNGGAFLWVLHVERPDGTHALVRVKPFGQTDNYEYLFDAEHRAIDEAWICEALDIKRFSDIDQVISA